MASTLSYLSSPPALSLGLPSPASPPPVYATPRQPIHDTLTCQVIPATPTPPASISQCVPDDATSTISSLMSDSWPLPPMSQYSRSQSGTPSLLSDDAVGAPLRRSITPPHLQSKPFEGSGIARAGPTPVKRDPSLRVPSPHLPSRRPSVKSIRRNWSREGLAQKYAQQEVIYMTVVQETA
jgi:hypothetical protein